MNPDEKNGRMDRDTPPQDFEAVNLDEMRRQLHEAIRAQERLQDELRAAVSDLSQAFAQQQRSTAAAGGDREFRRLESRVRGLEQRLNRTSEQVQAILQSRIWRTMVKVGGVLLRLQKFRR
jgi:predicted RNase H-like nuclease (RuvC/YqgF family)